MTAPLGGHTRDPEQLPKVKGPDDEDMHVFAQAGKIKKKITVWCRGDYIRRPMWYDTEF